MALLAQAPVGADCGRALDPAVRAPQVVGRPGAARDWMRAPVRRAGATHAGGRESSYRDPYSDPFCVYLLVATQDFAVDGWALEMLRVENVEYASLCNNLGQVVGILLSSTTFLVLGDADTCNRYFRAAPLPTPILSLTDISCLAGAVFIVVTLVVAVFTNERPPGTAAVETLAAAYDGMRRALALSPVRQFGALIALQAVGYSAVDSATAFELVELGVPMAGLGTLQLISAPIEVCVCVCVCVCVRARVGRQGAVARWCRTG
jgi:hypothetical protein